MASTISDELHQAPVPGRDPALRDVAIDVAGALIAVAMVGFVRTRSLGLRAKPWSKHPTVDRLGPPLVMQFAHLFATHDVATIQ